MNANGSTGEPTARINVKHDRLAKGGWRHETSVELVWNGGATDAEALARLARLLEQADTLGRREADRRELLDGRGE